VEPGAQAQTQPGLGLGREATSEKAQSVMRKPRRGYNVAEQKAEATFKSDEAMTENNKETEEKQKAKEEREENPGNEEPELDARKVIKSV